MNSQEYKEYLQKKIDEANKQLRDWVLNEFPKIAEQRRKINRILER